MISWKNNWKRTKDECRNFVNEIIEHLNVDSDGIQLVEIVQVASIKSCLKFRSRSVLAYIVCIRLSGAW